ncbi:hypothetical protein MD484_g2088, partial [Candolleomyces efflorescens]
MRGPLIHIPKNSAIYALGAANKRSKPLFETKDVSWTVNSKDSWALIGKAKNNVFQTLLGHTRVSPTPAHSLYPRYKDVDAFSRLKFVSFRHSGGNGEFYDYTARYGAMRDGDDKTLGQSFEEIAQELTIPRSHQDALIRQLGLEQLLDVPLIALSNGQTRRARIARAIFRQPEVLLLDEPLTGLDVESRERLLQLLESFRASPDNSPHVLSSYRLQEIVDLTHHTLQDIAPAFVSHVLYLEGDRFWAGPRDEFFGDFAPKHLQAELATKPWSTQSTTSKTALVADLQGVNVIYRGERKVLSQISWQIHQGDRWQLKGANGSGKTTLLSLITGDHPQSYTQPHLLLPSASADGAPKLQHRKRIPTPTLRSSIGIVSPELFDAFPRKEPGMTVWDAVQTGFGGGFVPAKEGVGKIHVDSWESSDVEKLREWRTSRCWDVLEALGPLAWDLPTTNEPPTSSSGDPIGNCTPNAVTRDFASRLFPSLSQGEQRLVLLMRALVGRPPLVILDEVWAGMDERMIEAVKRYFNSPSPSEAFTHDQAVVVVTHWEDEVPWTKQQGLKVFKLEKGSGSVL